ncbi:MAG TPA: hypothetical protein VEB61_02735 [Candidatus Binatia bacterium]|nr:hypothetical protein [Candidatus Binatia bacterium]
MRKPLLAALSAVIMFAPMTLLAAQAAKEPARAITVYKTPT